MKDWIVYVTPDNEVKAVESEYNEKQIDDLKGENNVIVGFPAAKRMDDAINYITQIMEV